MNNPKEKSRTIEISGTALEPLNLTTEEFIALDEAKAGKLIPEEARALFRRKLISKHGTITAAGLTVLNQGYTFLDFPEA